MRSQPPSNSAAVSSGIPQYPGVSTGLRSSISPVSPGPSTVPSPVTTRASFTIPSTGCWRTEPSVPYGLLPRAQISPYGDSDIA